MVRAAPQVKIEVVIAAEAPVSRSLLCRRVVQSCGISRADNRIQSRLDSILEKMNVRSTTQNDELFYWREDQLPDDYAGLRASAEGDNQRDVRDVAVQEVANAIYLVLHEQFSMGEEDLYREGARKLGYTRLGRNVLSALELGLQHAMQQGGIATGKNAAYVLSDLGSARAETVVASVLVHTDQARSE